MHQRPQPAGLAPSSRARLARRVAAALLAGAALLAIAPAAHAQLDTRHWLPPLWAAIESTSAAGNHWLTLTTPSTTPVAVTVTDGSGATVYSGTVANASPVQLLLGNFSTTTNYAPQLGLGHMLYGAADLNQKRAHGLIVTAAAPVYANIRNLTTAQGTSLTSKGRKALGLEFRAAVMPNVRNTTFNYRGVFVSVMATQEGTTTVTFDQLKPGIVLTGTTGAGSPPTTQPITITLAQHESYVVGIRDMNDTSTAPINDINGVRVTADKPVAVSSGGWLAGEGVNTGQDIGVDQIAPVNLAGTEYILMKGNAPNGDPKETPIVVATEDGTTLLVNGTTAISPTLDAGDYAFLTGHYTANDSMLVQASKPVLMFQSIGGSANTATPGFNFIPPLGEGADTFVDNVYNVQQLGAATLAIVARADATVTATANGNPLSLGTAKAVTGTTDWVTYRATNVTGRVAAYSDSPIAVAIFNISGDIGAAGYFSGFPAALVDLDFDGVPDGQDNCPDTANPRRLCTECGTQPQPDCDPFAPALVQCDADADATGDACDLCPRDPDKIGPGVCGCGEIEDVDPDTGECAVDLCPDNPDKDQPGICGCDVLDTDSDDDDTPDCNDDCVDDPGKTDPGTCGCGFPDEDADFDGTPDPCVIGGTCTDDAGCASGLCLEGRCEEPLCHDLERSGDESDVDCGGSCAPCGYGQGCFEPADCDTGACGDGGLCTCPHGQALDPDSPTLVCRPCAELDGFELDDDGACVDIDECVLSYETEVFASRDAYRAAVADAGFTATAIEDFESLGAGGGPSSNGVQILSSEALQVAFEPLWPGQSDQRPVTWNVSICGGMLSSGQFAILNNAVCGAWPGGLPPGPAITFRPLDPDRAIVAAGAFNSSVDDELIMTFYGEDGSVLISALIPPGSPQFVGIIAQVPATSVSIAPSPNNPGNGLIAFDDLELATQPRGRVGGVLCGDDATCVNTPGGYECITDDCPSDPDKLAPGVCGCGFVDQDACADGGTCTGGDGCQSGACLDGVCQPPSCTDLVENGDETDVDCGGGCEPCTIGEGCATSADCDTDRCDDGVCACLDGWVVDDRLTPPRCRPCESVPSCSDPALTCEALAPGDPVEVEVDPTCAAEVEVGALDPEVLWRKGAFTAAAAYNQIMMTPVAANLTDDNGDGLIDAADVPDIVFTRFTGGSHSSPGYLTVIDGASGDEIWSTAGLGPVAVGGSAGVALGDVDANGRPEICVGLVAGGSLACWEAAVPGSAGDPFVLKWGSALCGPATGASYYPAIADVDGDGLAEIVYRGCVLRHDGTLLGIGDQAAASNVPFAANLDADPELEIVDGRYIYDLPAAGSTDLVVKWTIPGAGNVALPAVADFDGDGRPEIVLADRLNGQVILFDPDGADDADALDGWTIPFGDGGSGARGGPPNIADFTGDGFPEVGIAGQLKYVVYRRDGSVLWSANVQDGSSRVTGSAVFDFDGDGSAEVVYADEETLWIYDGATGAVRAQFSDHASGTLFENPIILDVDGDGRTEIVLASNNYSRPGWTGVTVFGSQTDSWSPSRPIWNQHAYSISNVNDDGSIPAVAVPNWTRWNNFRTAAQREGLASWLTDLYVVDDAACVSGCFDDNTTATVEVRLRVANRGLLDASDVVVTFTAGNVEGPVVGGTTLGSVPSGEVVVASAQIDRAVWGEERLWVHLEPAETTPDCEEGDNFMALGWAPHVADDDDDGLEDACDDCIVPEPEVCDGRDNSCNGLVDADDPALVRQACELQVGACAGALAPVSYCVDGGWLACDEAAYAAHSDAYDTGPDLCDGVDNDCDDEADEDYVGVATSCGVGICAAAGMTVCENGVEGDTCAPGEPADDEVCNGDDDDCDGFTDAEDADLVLVACELQDGICAGATKPASLCVDGGWRECPDALYAGHAWPALYSPGADDSCDGLDSDCSGQTDEDFDEAFGEVTTCGVGACAGATGALVCVEGGVEDTCDPVAGASDEACNGADDDCDGIVDGDGEGGSVCGPIDTAATCPAGDVGDDGVTITFSNPLVSGGAAFECRLDGGDWVPCEDGTFAAGELGAGQHVFEVRAVDSAGNVDPTPAVCVWTVDTEAPDTFIDVGPEEVSTSTMATFAFGSDEAPVTFWCALDPVDVPPASDAYVPCDAVEIYEDLADGEHALWVYAVDAAGNADETPAMWSWVVATGVPETEITSGPTGPVLEGDAVTFTYEEPTDEAHETFECRVDEGPWMPCDGGEVTYEDLGLGLHTFEVRACDPQSGVCDDTAARWVFEVVDLICTEPLVLVCAERLEVDAPADACVWAGEVTATATRACVQELIVTAERDVFPVGTSTAVFEASDELGNEATCETEVVVRDVTAPVVSCGVWDEGGQRTRVSGEDACGVDLSVEDVGCARLVDGAVQPVDAADCPVTVDGTSVLLTGGLGAPLVVTWTVRGEDPSGNVSEAPCEVAVDPDTDGDGFVDSEDVCPLVANPEQSDVDLDDIGDACDEVPIEGLEVLGGGGCHAAGGGLLWPLLVLGLLALFIGRRRRRFLAD